MARPLLRRSPQQERGRHLFLTSGQHGQRILRMSRAMGLAVAERNGPAPRKTNNTVVRAGTDTTAHGHIVPVARTE
eukprot:14586043-Alexandrium_andersonii.AAC.1